MTPIVTSLRVCAMRVFVHVRGARVHGVVRFASQRRWWWTCQDLLRCDRYRPIDWPRSDFYKIRRTGTIITFRLHWGKSIDLFQAVSYTVIENCMSLCNEISRQLVALKRHKFAARKIYLRSLAPMLSLLTKQEPEPVKVRTQLETSRNELL